MRTKNGKGSKKTGGKTRAFFTDEKIKFIAGILITGFAFYLLLACVSYLFWWKTDQSLPDSQIISGSEVVVKNWSGKSGHFLAKFMISSGFGLGGFFIPLIVGVTGLYLLNFPKLRPMKLITKFALAAILLSSTSEFYFRTGRFIPGKRARRCSWLQHN
jgi:DNA segregation ATPase FtsK/SpoIIIE, S-DNA-T family